MGPRRSQGNHFLLRRRVPERIRREWRPSWHIHGGRHGTFTRCSYLDGEFDYAGVEYTVYWEADQKSTDGPLGVLDKQSVSQRKGDMLRLLRRYD